MKYTILIVFITLMTFLGCSYYPEHPEITAVYPEANTTGVDSATEIRITFSKEMNANITAREFSLSSATGSIDGFFTWDNNNKLLVFTPKEALTNTGAYTIAITQFAEDTDGIDLNKQFKSEFYITADIDKPEVLSHIPADKATGVLSGSPITITFSEAINLNSLYDYSGFSISPAVEGVFSWDSAQTIITFTPAEELSYGTIYTVTIGEGLADSSGNKIREAHSFSFTVGDDSASPTVSSVYQLQTPLPSVTLSESGTTSGIEKSIVSSIITANDIIIEFNELVNTADLSSAISFSPSASYYIVPGNSAGHTIARIVFTASLTQEQTYALTISTDIKDLQNNALNRDYTYTFITNGTYSTAPVIAAINDPTEAPANQNWDLATGAIKTLNLVATHQNIRITFSRKVNPTTMNISIQKLFGTGSTNVTETSWPDMTDPLPVVKLTVFEFDLLAGFLAGDVYKLTIKGGSSGLQDIYGNYLAEDLVRIFQF